MSRGLNRVELLGNLGADPEPRYLPNGTLAVSLNVATSENRKAGDGEWEEHTEWHRVVMFGRRAEVAKDYLHKGSRVFLAGKLRTRSWDKDGVKHYMTEVVALEMIMLDGRQGNNAGNNASAANDDLPF